MVKTAMSHAYTLGSGRLNSNVPPLIRIPLGNLPLLHRERERKGNGRGELYCSKRDDVYFDIEHIIILVHTYIHMCMCVCFHK